MPIMKSCVWISKSFVIISNVSSRAWGIEIIAWNIHYSIHDLCVELKQPDSLQSRTVGADMTVLWDSQRKYSDNANPPLQGPQPLCTMSNDHGQLTNTHTQADLMIHYHNASSKGCYPFQGQLWQQTPLTTWLAQQLTPQRLIGTSS